MSKYHRGRRIAKAGARLTDEEIYALVSDGGTRTEGYTQAEVHRLIEYVRDLYENVQQVQRELDEAVVAEPQRMTWDEALEKVLSDHAQAWKRLAQQQDDPDSKTYQGQAGDSQAGTSPA